MLLLIQLLFLLRKRSLSQWGGICRNVSLAQYFTSAWSKLIFLCHTHTFWCVRPFKMIYIVKQSDTYFVALISSNLPSETSSFFKRQINILNLSYASIHSVSIAVLYSFWSVGTEECRRNGYCCNLIGFDMLKEL